MYEIHLMSELGPAPVIETEEGFLLVEMMRLVTAGRYNCGCAPAVALDGSAQTRVNSAVAEPGVA